MTLSHYKNVKVGCIIKVQSKTSKDWFISVVTSIVWHDATGTLVCKLLVFDIERSYWDVGMEVTIYLPLWGNMWAMDIIEEADIEANEA